MIDGIIDWETIGPAPSGKVIELSFIPFDSSLTEDITFSGLVAKGRKFKFNLKTQPKRVSNASTLEWWKKQSDEAKKILIPSDEDLELKDGITQFLDFVKESGIDPWKSHMFCRGQSFDFPILVDVIREVYETDDTFNLEPVKFWNQRDVRTAIEYTMLQRDLTTCPLPNGTLNGFVMHNSIHDCAKDILMLKYATLYAKGELEYPTDIDPLSQKTGH